MLIAPTDEGWPLALLGISHTLQSHLGAPHRGSEKSQCWDAAKGGTSCRHKLWGASLAKVQPFTPPQQSRAMSLVFLALSHALRKKIIKNSGVWMNVKESQSLSQKTGIHEAFLTRVGITTNGRRSLAPLQAKKKKDSSRGTRELCWCKGRIRQDLKYTLETSSPIWMLRHLCSPGVWPQIAHKEKVLHKKKRGRKDVVRMPEALELRQSLGLFLNSTDDLLCYFRQVTHFVTQLSCKNNLSFPGM